MAPDHQNPGIILPDAARMPEGSTSFWRWLYFFLHPYRKILLSFTVLRVARFSILAMLPLVVGTIINGFEQGWATETPEKMTTLLVGYFSLYAIALFSIVFFRFESMAQDKMIRGMTLFSIAHINSLPLSWHEEQGSGGKLQRVMTARSSLKNLYNLYKWFLTPFTGTLIGICVSVVLLKAPLYFLLMYLGFALSFFIAAWHTAKPLPKLHNRHNELLEGLLAGVYEFVSAVRTVKAFNMEDYIARKAWQSEGAGLSAWRAVLGAIFKKWGILNSVGLFWILAFLLTCVSGVYGGWLTVGAFAASFYMTLDLWRMLENMVFIQDEFIEYRNGFMRLTETLTTKPEPLDREPAAPMKYDWQEMKFENVSFHYSGAAKEEARNAALHDIAFSLRRGEKIALVGPSGAGKSTLVKLLMKQMWPSAGTITLDGTDLRHVKNSQWLATIGFVPQDVELFNMSIRDNILLDRADDFDEIAYRKALQEAAFADFVDSLPEGDRTVIGERGVRLSGGQRQRLGIARALVRNADLIVFDEATSALDSLSEQAIQQAIEESFAGKTLVVIAHRLSTVRHVDRIFVLEDGKIAEQGTFDDLVAAKSVFARMWALQSDHYMKEAV